MTFLKSTALIGLALLVSGCAQNGLFDGPGRYDTALTGPVGDPTTPAYFNQTIGDRVLFLVDQSTLTPEAEAILAQQAEWLMTNGTYTALIEGHADEQGTREYNLALGARRAGTVRDFLVSRGVAESRLQIVSYGKERPLEICSNESCYARNRRAVTVLQSGLGS